MYKIAAVLLSFFIPCFLYSQNDSIDYLPVQAKFSFDWGNNVTDLLVSQYGQRRDVVMIHVHDNEFTSAKAAEEVLRQTGGMLIEIENHGRRLISFKKSGKKFFFDPNRVFTRAGRQKNLRFLNGHVTSPAVSSVKAFSAFILQRIPDTARLVVALHNNSNGKYSIKSYRSSGYWQREVSRICINRNRDPDNFYILTSKKIFNEVKKAGYNAVLQSSAKARDDGSLSFYFGRRNITYINVEAQQGSLQEQERMVRSVLKLALTQGVDQRPTGK